MNLMPGIGSTASALNAEKLRMNIIAQNIANAYTTKDADGEGAYRRKIVAFEAYLDKANGPQTDGTARLHSVRVATVTDDTKPGPMIYNPGHPDANADGMVEMPNVEVSREMVDMISSSRAYEANLQVARTARQLARQALAIGRRS